MAKNNEKKEKMEVRDFYSVYTPEQVREIDDRIMEAQRKYNAQLQNAMRKAKDFVMTH